MKNLFCVLLLSAFCCITYSQIPSSGNVLWLKAGQAVYNDNGNTLASIGHTVQVWADQSGQGNDFVQTDAGTRPVMQMIPNVLCSQPAIYFDPGRRTFLSSTMLLSGAKSIFIVFLMPQMNNAANELLSLKGNTDEFTEIIATDFAGYRPLTFIADLPSTAAGNYYLNSTGINTNFSDTGNILSFFYNGGNITSVGSYNARYDNTPSTVMTNELVGRYTDDVSTIGARAPFQNINFLKGYIAEIIVYNRLLSSTEADDVDNYLISKYGFRGACTILPLNLMEFKAALFNRVVKLSWKSAAETNVQEYSAEYSKDGTHFSSFTMLKPFEDLVNDQNYSCIHPSASSGANYYRLRIQKKDGTFEYSPIRKITIDDLTEDPPIAFPNPFSEFIFIKADSREQYQITIMNSEGQTCQQKKLSGNNSLNLACLPPGLYMLTISGKKGITKHKIIKR